MKLGILSDSHGKIDITRRAVDMLQSAGATHFVHCGDVGDIRVLDVLAGRPAWFVFGNNDWDHDEYAAYAKAIGVTCLGTGGVIALAGRHVAVTHGDDARTVARLGRPDAADYLLSGHSHLRHDQRIGTLRWINPGALYRATVKSVALLDLEKDAMQFLDVPDSPR